MSKSIDSNMSQTTVNPDNKDIQNLKTSLYPEIIPHKTGFLLVDNIYGHELYWEECGNPEGIPVVFIHGGPGAGASPTSRRFFDPTFYRIIIYDQRGSGRSTPFAETRNNTTPLLIEDLEALRKHLNIDKWLLFGGSWGSTLAIAYGIHHPNRCLGFILRGIFLCRESEINWLLYGLKNLYPEQWRTFAHHIPENQRSNLLKAYYTLLMNPDPQIHMPAAVLWSSYEEICSTLLPNSKEVASFQNENRLAIARIEAHYFYNQIFLAPNFLMTNLSKIRGIPTHIIQGRYDLICPIITADEVAGQLPEASYTIIPDAGHSAYERGICQELVKTCEIFKNILKPQ